jgi:hypothetical protein
MKKIFALLLLLIYAPTLCPAGSFTGDLDISITLTKGERSKDSHSTKRSITLKGRQLNYDVTYHGRTSGRKEPVHKVFQINDSEIEKLREIINQHDLLNSAKKEFPATGGYTYFDISMSIRVNEKESSINLNGNPRNTEIKEDIRYKNVEALVKEIYSIIHKRDETVDYFGMID